MMKSLLLMLLLVCAVPAAAAPITINLVSVANGFTIPVNSPCLGGSIICGAGRTSVTVLNPDRSFLGDVRFNNLGASIVLDVGQSAVVSLGSFDWGGPLPDLNFDFLIQADLGTTPVEGQFTSSLSFSLATFRAQVTSKIIPPDSNAILNFGNGITLRVSGVTTNNNFLQVMVTRQDVAPIPEPTTVVLLASGLVGLGLRRCRRRI